MVYGVSVMIERIQPKIEDGCWGSDLAMIRIIENFIDEEEALAISEYMSKNDVWDECQTVDFWKKRVHTYDLFTNQEILNLTMNITQNIKHEIEKSMSVCVRQSLSSIVVWRKGDGINPPHVDKSPDNPDYDIGSILYLNDNYDGGSIYFPIQQMELKPKKHSLIFFPGDSNFPHGVRCVSRGERYTIPNFWKILEMKAGK